MSQEEQGESKAVDYDLMLYVIKLMQATKHLLEVISYEKLEKLEKYIVEEKIKNMIGKKRLEIEVERIEELSETPII